MERDDGKLREAAEAWRTSQPKGFEAEYSGTAPSLNDAFVAGAKYGLEEAAKVTEAWCDGWNEHQYVLAAKARDIRALSESEGRGRERANR